MPNYLLYCEKGPEDERISFFERYDTLEEANCEGIRFNLMNRDNPSYEVFERAPETEFIYFFCLIRERDVKDIPVAFGFNRRSLLELSFGENHEEGDMYRLVGWKRPMGDLAKKTKDLAKDLYGFVNPDLFVRVLEKPLSHAEIRLKLHRKEELEREKAVRDLESAAPDDTDLEEASFEGENWEQTDSPFRKPQRHFLGMSPSLGGEKLKSVLKRLEPRESDMVYFVRYFDYASHSTTTETIRGSREYVIDYMTAIKDFYDENHYEFPDMYAIGWKKAKVVDREDLDFYEWEERYMKGGFDDFILFHYDPDRPDPKEFDESSIFEPINEEEYGI